MREGEREGEDEGGSEGEVRVGVRVRVRVLSLSEQKFYTRNVHYDGRVFQCKMEITKIINTFMNQVEIAQNEIWTK